MTPKSLTGRKLFGKYFHSLSRHAGKQLRIVCGKSSHTEQEERQFNLLKTITKLTSNHHTNNVIFNIWVRLQAKKMGNEKHCTFEKENSMISKLNTLLPPKENSFVYFEHINSKPDEWQALLEIMIPDYLIDGVWWKKNEMGIEFLDCIVNNLSKIRKHHYRSSTISQEEKYLKDMWEMCINNKMLVPAKIIKQEINDSSIITPLSTIKYFQPIHFLQETTSHNVICSTVTEDLMESQNSSDPNVDFTISRSNEIAKLDSLEIKINIIEITELTTYPDCLKSPSVSDVVYNNAINCDDLDEQIEINEDHIENLKPAISTLYASDNT